MSETEVTQPHRAGVVALLGRPNAGKSTLLNRLVGEKLAIVTDKPQTTRSRILGILNLPGAQVLLVDTPGMHKPRQLLNEVLVEIVDEALRDCDLAVLLVDLSAGWQPSDAILFERIQKLGKPHVLVGTKTDLTASEASPWPPPEVSAELALRVSAKTGQGVDELLTQVVARLPESPAYYPDDQLTDRPLRWLAAELVREAAFEALAEEVPYSLAVEVEEFDETRADLVRIRANLLVARASQKGIVIGAGGERIKQIGSQARRQIVRLLGQRVHLELWAKHEPDWARKRKRLNKLGYS